MLKNIFSQNEYLTLKTKTGFMDPLSVAFSSQISTCFLIPLGLNFACLTFTDFIENSLSYFGHILGRPGFFSRISIYPVFVSIF